MLESAPGDPATASTTRRLLAVVLLVIAVGALIILRPGSAVFSPAAVFPLLAAVFYTGFLGALLTAVALHGVGRPVRPGEEPRC